MKSEIEKELFQYFVRLNESQKHSLLELMKSFLDTGGDPLNPVSIEQYNRELDEAMERINKGNFTNFEELEKRLTGIKPAKR